MVGCYDICWEGGASSGRIYIYEQNQKLGGLQSPYIASYIKLEFLPTSRWRVCTPGHYLDLGVLMVLWIKFLRTFIAFGYKITLRNSVLDQEWGNLSYFTFYREMYLIIYPIISLSPAQPPLKLGHVSKYILLYHTWVWNRGICMCVIVRPRSHMLIVLKKVIPDTTRYDFA